MNKVIRRILGTALLFLVGLSGCSSDDNDSPQTEHKEPEILQHQLKALEDAKKLEQTMQSHEQALRNQIDQQTDDDSAQKSGTQDDNNE